MGLSNLSYTWKCMLKNLLKWLVQLETCLIWCSSQVTKKLIWSTPHFTCILDGGPDYLIKSNRIQWKKTAKDSAVSLTGLFLRNSQVFNCITVIACFCHIFVTHVLNSVGSLNLFVFCLGDWFLRSMKVCSFSAACSKPWQRGLKYLVGRADVEAATKYV